MVFVTPALVLVGLAVWAWCKKSKDLQFGSRQGLKTERRGFQRSPEFSPLFLVTLVLFAVFYDLHFPIVVNPAFTLTVLLFCLQMFMSQESYFSFSVLCKSEGTLEIKWPQFYFQFWLDLLLSLDSFYFLLLASLLCPLVLIRYAGEHQIFYLVPTFSFLQ